MEHNSAYEMLLTKLRGVFDQRFSQGVSMRALARQIDMDPGTLSRILSGKRRINPQQAVAVVERLEITGSEKTVIIELLVRDALHSSLTMFNEHYISMSQSHLPKEIILEAIQSLSQDVARP